MNTFEHSNVSFTDPEMNEFFTPEMGKLGNKIVQICNDAAYNQFGGTYFPNPSTVELTPYINSTGVPQPEFIVRARHETGIPGKSAVFQNHDSAITLAFIGEDAYMRNDDTSVSYLLTTREAFFVASVASYATARYIHDNERE